LPIAAGTAVLCEMAEMRFPSPCDARALGHFHKPMTKGADQGRSLCNAGTLSLDFQT